MANWKFFGKCHQQVHRLTNGRIGSRMAGIDMVIIETIGRKTGQLRAVPIACYPCADDVTVVASNNGSDKHPVWWLNLQATPKVFIRVGRQRYKVMAEEMSAAERKQFWPEIVKLNPAQAHHQKKSSRLLPVIRFRRL